MFALVAFSTLLLVGLLVEPLAKRIYLPFSVLLVIVGFIGSEIIVQLGYDTGLRWHHFTELILHVLLPVLIFESAFNLDASALRKDIAIVLLLAVPLVVVATLITGYLIYIGIGHGTGFPLIMALLTGAILSSTDPVAVIALFKKLGAPKRLLIILEGESLFNDVVSIVLFTILVMLAQASQVTFELSVAMVEFLRVYFGGLLAGTLVGACGYFILQILKTPITWAVVTVIAVIFCLYISEHLWETSGVMAVLISGLILGIARRKSTVVEFSQTFWEFIAYVANVILFLLLGITITLTMFEEQWLAMLIGIGAVLVTRVTLIFGALPLTYWLPGIEPISHRYQTVMVWGALRGAVTVALALSLPLELDGWFTIQSIAYGVVLFTLIVQAPTLSILLRRIKLV